MFKIRKLLCTLFVSCGFGLVNAAQVDPVPGDAGPVNPLGLTVGRTPQLLWVLAMRAEARRFLRLPQNENLSLGTIHLRIEQCIQGLSSLPFDRVQFRNEIIRQHYLLRGQHMPGLTDKEARRIYRFSIQELFNNRRMPAIVDNILDLSKYFIGNLDGLTQIPQVNTLRALHLANNQITEICPNVFQGLNNLQWLYLYHNQITEIHADTFQGLGNLQVLSLEHNQIAPAQREGLRGQIEGEVGHEIAIYW